MRRVKFYEAASSAILALAVVCSSACGAGDPEANTECRDLGGQWEVTTHCDSDELGKSITIIQNGCDVTIVEYDFEGSVSENGDFSAGGVPGDSVINCEGFASENRITQNCTGECDVVLERS